MGNVCCTDTTSAAPHIAARPRKYMDSSQSPRRGLRAEQLSWERCVVALREGEKKVFGEEQQQPTSNAAEYHPFSLDSPRSPRGSGRRDFLEDNVQHKDIGGLLSPATSLLLSGKPDSISDWSVFSQDNALPFQLTEGPQSLPFSSHPQVTDPVVISQPSVVFSE